MVNFYKNEAQVVYASDDRFAEILGVSMVSLFENSKDMDEIVIYILDGGIKNDNKRRLEAVCKQYNRRVPVWIHAKSISEELSIEVTVDRGSLSQYARLFVSSILPDTLKRVLYLDCDVLINRSISELWNLDLHGKTIAALMDAFSKEYRTNINLQPEDIMFNSGVMLIDLCRWKARRVEEKLMRFITMKNGRIQQGDQGALNAILSHDVYCFEPRFNSVSIYYDFTYDEMLMYRKPPKFYSREQLKMAVDDPSIIHFTTSFLSRRPWEEGCQHKYVGDWRKYKELSPWVDDPMWIYVKPKGAEGMYVKLVSSIPRKLMIVISGLLQAYGRPLINKVKY